VIKTKGNSMLGLYIICSAVLVFIASPIIYLIYSAVNTNLNSYFHLVFRRLTLTLFLNTFYLTVSTVVISTILGTLLALLCARTNVRFKRVIHTILILPIAIPDFVVAFSWLNIIPGFYGFLPALIVMTLGLFPYTYLPAYVSFSQLDSSQEEIARSLGASGPKRALRLSIAQARGPILVGASLIAFNCLTEYGAFQLLGYRTLTTEIYSAWSLSFNSAVASALSLILFLMGLVVLFTRIHFELKTGIYRVGKGTYKKARIHNLGFFKIPAEILLIAVCFASVGVPILSSLKWLFKTKLTFDFSQLADSLKYSLFYGFSSGILAVIIALLFSYLSFKKQTTAAKFITNASFMILAVPTVIVGLAFSVILSRYVPGLYLSPTALIAAYVLISFPLALTGMKSAFLRISPKMIDTARSLGSDSLKIFVKIIVPLIFPGVLVSFMLVFLTTISELTVTLMLIPGGQTTLSLEFFKYASSLSLNQASAFALIIIALGFITQGSISLVSNITRKIPA
jgi:iron(III) transport system permease protein